MPLHRFVFQDSDAVPEVVVQFADDNEARTEAITSARQTAADSILQGKDPRNWSVHVYGEDGRLVCVVDFDSITQ